MSEWRSWIYSLYFRVVSINNWTMAVVVGKFAHFIQFASTTICCDAITSTNTLGLLWTEPRQLSSKV